MRELRGDLAIGVYRDFEKDLHDQNRTVTLANHIVVSCHGTCERQLPVRIERRLPSTDEAVHVTCGEVGAPRLPASWHVM